MTPDGFRKLIDVIQDVNTPSFVSQASCGLTDKEVLELTRGRARYIVELGGEMIDYFKEKEDVSLRAGMGQEGHQ